MYREYFEEHPEEYAGIKAILDRNAQIEASLRERREAKQKQVKEWREKLHAKYSV